jgi:hypothetical protein
VRQNVAGVDRRLSDVDHHRMGALIDPHARDGRSQERPAPSGARAGERRCVWDGLTFAARSMWRPESRGRVVRSSGRGLTRRTEDRRRVRGGPVPVHGDGPLAAASCLDHLPLGTGCRTDPCRALGAAGRSRRGAPHGSGADAAVRLGPWWPSRRRVDREVLLARSGHQRSQLVPLARRQVLDGADVWSPVMARPGAARFCHLLPSTSQRTRGACMSRGAFRSATPGGSTCSRLEDLSAVDGAAVHRTGGRIAPAELPCGRWRRSCVDPGPCAGQARVSRETDRRRSGTSRRRLAAAYLRVSGTSREAWRRSPARGRPRSRRRVTGSCGSARGRLPGGCAVYSICVALSLFHVEQPSGPPAWDRRLPRDPQRCFT